MGFFKSLFSTKTVEEIEKEIEGIKFAQKTLDERFEKKQVSNEFYTSKSMEYREKIEKLEKKLPKEY